MALPSAEPAFLPRDVYRRYSSDLLALKSTMPKEAVVSLAQEVLSRLSTRVSDPASRSDMIITLSNALIADDPSAAADLIEDQYQAGVTTQALYLGFLAPAARQLGEWWEADEVSFADVTLGTGRMYGIMRSLARHMPVPTLSEAKSAFVACVPGETHILGARMAADLLRDEGWSIDLSLDSDHGSLMDQIEQGGHLLIGFSAAGQHALPALAKLVIATRLCQPRAAILVSGNIVGEARNHIGLMGVDAVGQTYAEASDQLDRLWKNLKA